MPFLDDLLTEDANTAACWRRTFSKLDLGFPEAFDAASDLFMRFNRCVGEKEDESVTQASLTLERYAQTSQLSVEEVIERIRDPVRASSAPLEVRQAYLCLWSWHTAMIMLLLLQRSYTWGATDLFRMRVNAAEGYRRLQAEAVGLLILMRRDPKVSEDWFAILTDDEGQKFFGKYQSDLKKVLKSTNLASAYNMGSSISQHVRLASAAQGISFEDAKTSLSHKNFPTDPFGAFIAILSFLTTQAYVFRAIDQAFPGVTDSSWHTGVNLFLTEVQRLWRRLEECFPEECRASDLRLAADKTLDKV